MNNPLRIGGEKVKITIEIDEKEIAALMGKAQERRQSEIDINPLLVAQAVRKAICDTAREAADSNAKK